MKFLLILLFYVQANFGKKVSRTFIFRFYWLTNSNFKLEIFDYFSFNQFGHKRSQHRLDMGGTNVPSADK